MKNEVSENITLDKEEQWIEDNLENFVPAEKWVGESLREAAKKPPLVHTTEEKPNKKMFTLRLDQGDLSKLKTLAEEQGLPYQSLLGSVIHRYVNGTLVDITEAKKILVFQKA